MSLPMEVHQQIMLHLDHRSLLKFSRTNHHLRGLYMVLPAADIQASINEFLDLMADCSHSWLQQDQWNLMWLFEQTNQDFLKKIDMFPCYYCWEIMPSNEFGDWAAKRLTEIYNGVPLSGACSSNHTEGHDVFHFVMDQEAKGRVMRTEDDLTYKNQSYLQVVEGIKDGGGFFQDCYENSDVILATVMGEFGDDDDEDEGEEEEEASEVDEEEDRQSGDEDHQDDEHSHGLDGDDDRDGQDAGDGDAQEEYDNADRTNDEVISGAESQGHYTKD